MDKASLNLLNKKIYHSLNEISMYLDNKISIKVLNYINLYEKNLYIFNLDKKIFNLKNKKFNLQVPHPRLQFRNFVMVPLFEVDKKWKHPKLNENVANLILKNDINDLRSIKFV